MPKPSDAEGNPFLGDRIEECLRLADEKGLPLVAAHLDAALGALRGIGVWPEGELGEAARPPRLDS